MTQYSRHDFLCLAALGAGASVLAACAPVATATPTEPSRQLVLRIAHISDMHIESSGPGQELFSRVLRNIQSLSPSVDFVINAGDCVIDTLYSNKKGWMNSGALSKASFRRIFSSLFIMPFETMLCGGGA